MNNRLFFICPECHLEHFTRGKYDNDIFFITALGSVFNFGEVNSIKAIMDLINREAITDIFIVNDTSCGFINSVLKKEQGLETFSLEVMSNLLIDNYSFVMNNKSLFEQNKTLAELNIRRQTNEIMNSELFQLIIQNKINIKGLITTKAENKLIELHLNH